MVSHVSENGAIVDSVNLSLHMSPGLAAPLKFNCKDFSSESLPKGHSLGRLSPKQLKSLLEYAEHKFRFDQGAPLGLREQFCGFLSRECSRLLNPELRPGLSVSEKRELAKLIKDCHADLERSAKVFPGTLKDTVSFMYHDGFNHLTRDDDFIAVRCGNSIVEIIPLPGNDFNELKKFIQAGGVKVLSDENVRRFREAVRVMKKKKVFELAQKRTRRLYSSGLSIKKV